MYLLHQEKEQKKKKSKLFKNFNLTICVLGTIVLINILNQYNCNFFLLQWRREHLNQGR